MRTSILVLAAFAGFVGGSIGSCFSPLGLGLPSVYAQGPGVEIIQSENFVLLDSSGHKRGEWRMDRSGLPVLRRFDAQGSRHLGHYGNSSRQTNARALAWISTFDVALQLSDRRFMRGDGPVHQIADRHHADHVVAI